MIRAALLAALLAGPAVAQQAPSLADLRADLRSLSAEMQTLRAELKASGAAGYQAAGGDSAIDRMNAMEAAIARLTGQSEQLQARIARIASDGARRIGDIEFRLCEMDETCDLGALMSQGDLGSAAVGVAVQVSPPKPPETGATSLSNDEKAAFDAAKQALDRGEFLQAAEKFAALAETHAGGALTAQALYLRGVALDSAGQPAAAAGAWLEGFAADPNSPHAGATLLGLARLAGQGGDTGMACLYLSEIPARFPGSDSATQAEAQLARMTCASNAAGADIDPEAAADLADHG